MTVSGYDGYWPLVPLDDGGIIFRHTSDVYHLDVDLNFINNIYTSVTSFQSSYLIYQGDVFIIHNSGYIARVNIQTGNFVTDYQLTGVTNIARCIVLQDLLWICSDHDLDEIFSYHLETHAKEVLVNTGCNDANDFVICKDCSPNSRYIVVCRGENKVATYNETWTETASVGDWAGGYGSGPQQFRDCKEMALSSNKTVFVTDQQNNRIQEFTTDLQFVRTLLSAADGINSVWAMRYTRPYVFAVFYNATANDNTLVRYQIYTS